MRAGPTAVALRCTTGSGESKTSRQQAKLLEGWEVFQIVKALLCIIIGAAPQLGFRAGGN